MDYKALGLKCGIEIHQQLEGQKLFCSCPTQLRDDTPHFQIRRKIRAVAGEGGNVDIAALQEQFKDKVFVYQGYKDSTCLVEVDCEPPHTTNTDALYTALQFCQLVQAQVSPVVQVMRKIIVNGSNTSGFQRTALIARGGIITTSEGEIHIDNINLEEDSAREIHESTNDQEIIYRLDRLGIPLIEVGTAPDIISPLQCQEAAKKLGLLLRSLPGVKRGLGTIRQDLNISIAGGTRIEVKGAQDLRLIPTIIELEVKRQNELLKLKEYLLMHKIKLNSLQMVDLSSIFTATGSALVQKTLQKQGKVLGVKLHQFKGLLGRELMPNYRLGTELSSRAKVIAGVGGLFHCDELPNYGITAEEVTAIRQKLGCAADDGFIIIADAQNKAQKALEAAYARIAELWQGIPKEVRCAQEDGTTRYLRPLPGAARMYPETDVPLIKPNLKHIIVPETLEEKMIRYQQELGLGKDLAQFIAKSNKVQLFEQVVKQYPSLKAAFIAETLTSTLIEIKRKYNLNSELLDDLQLAKVFEYLSQDKIHKDIVLDVLLEMIQGTFTVEKYAGLSTEALHLKIKEIVNKNKNAPLGALMGICMKELSGQTSGKTISDALKMILEKGHK